jgi:signal transduction histidine kinase
VVERGSLAPGRKAQASREDVPLVLVVLAGLALTGAVAAITASGLPHDEASLAALGRALGVAVPIAVGIYAWRAEHSKRFGQLLVATAFGWGLSSLAESGDELVYSVGRVAGWITEVGVSYLILAFPSGRLGARTDVLLISAMAAVVAVFYVPTALIADSYPIPTEFTSCTEGCPGNAFFLLSSQPAFVGSVLIPVREVLTVLLFTLVLLRLRERVRGATAVARLTLAPVLLIGSTQLALVAVGLGVRAVLPDESLVPTLVKWALALALAAVALAFLVGLLRRRLYMADALQALGTRVKPTFEGSELRDVLADTLEDPSLQILYRVDEGHWVDADAARARPPGAGSGRAVTEVRSGRRLVAAIVHDEALAEQLEFVEAAASYALMAIENQRLAAKVESSLGEVYASRSRVLAAADRERRRIERDLHDGAQQRLVALRIQLELLQDQIRADPERGIEKVNALGEVVDETLDSIRALAHGVYPSLLTDHGLADALRAAARTAPLPCSVHTDGAGRYPAEIESAVYFCCLEALQNASKHAAGARHLEISLSEDDRLRFEVRDDGAGFDPELVRCGAGLTNMRDRLASVGGEVHVVSVPASGTTVGGSVPLVPG